MGKRKRGVIFVCVCVVGEGREGWGCRGLSERGKLQVRDGAVSGDDVGGSAELRG